MIGSELRARQARLDKEQKERAERARRKAEAERILQERQARRAAAREEEKRQERLAELARQEQERELHEEELEANNGVYYKAELLAVPASEDAASSKGIKRGADKVLLPRSVGDSLLQQDASRNGVSFFLLTTAAGVSTAAGVLDFSAAEGTVALPRKVMRSLWGPDAGAGSPQRVTVQYKRLEKGTYVRFQPRLAGFHQEVGDAVNAALEAALFTHSALSEGDWVEVRHENEMYDLKVLQLQPGPHVSVIDTEMEAEVEPSMETEERIAAEEAAAAQRLAALAAQAAEEERRQVAAEQAAAQKEADRERIRQEKEASLPPEPSAGAAEPITTCLLRLPDGSRAARRFRRTDPVQLLFHFADAKGGGGNAPGSYNLVTQFPRQVIPADSSLTLAAAGLTNPQEVVFIEPTATADN